MIGFFHSSFLLSRRAVRVAETGSANESSRYQEAALAGLGPAIHDLKPRQSWNAKTWMPGSSPGKAVLRWWERVCVLPAAIAVGIVLIAAPAHAVRPDEMLADPGLEARARDISRDLRCLVCRNQSIDDSDADLAHDLRVLVRERITAGDSNDQVIGFVRARYGDFVLLRPPFAIGTALLWGGPFLVLLLGGVAIARFYRRRVEATPPLSPEERQRLAAVLGEEAGRGGAR
jgi:cytochrome c-type biogenesis protein CcmH